jgi:hypothetical protein
MRYFALVNHEADLDGYSEPGLDARLDGTFGPHFAVAVDARARRTLRAGREDDGRTRVYRLNGEWHLAETGPRLVVGRQFSTSLSSVSLFDGVRAEYRGTRWGAGAFSGTQPDPVDWGLSSRVREHGAYAELRGAPAAASRWVLTLAGIGSYADGEIDREYAALQGRWIGRRVSGFVVQEVDMNRDWKREAGESALSWTSAQVSSRVRVTDAGR